MDKMNKMIEVFDKKHKRMGYIDGKKYLNKKKKLLGFLEENVVKRMNGSPIFMLDKHKSIKSNGGSKYGFILDSKICDDNGPIFEFSKEKGEIYNSERNTVLYLEGDLEKIEDVDFCGIATIYLKSVWSERVLGFRVL